MNARKNVKCPNRCQIECQKECQIHIDRMSVYMPERMSHRMSEMDRHVIYCKMQNDLSELCQDSFSGLGSLNMEFYVCMYLSYTFEHLQVIHIEHCHILITMPYRSIYTSRIFQMVIQKLCQNYAKMCEESDCMFPFPGL